MYWITHNGLTSEKCYPFASGETGTKGTCSSTCKDGSDIELYLAKEYKDFDYTWDVMDDLSDFGPLVGCILAYEDFLNYKSGIYQHVTGDDLGVQCGRLIGWGNDIDSESGDKFYYWIIANSWGTSWGEEGYFKVKQKDFELNPGFFSIKADF